MQSAIKIMEGQDGSLGPKEEGGFGSLETAKGHLPLRAIDVKTRISGVVATTRLKQVFVNTYDEPLEATYIFPLPPRAAVSHFELRVAGRAVVGELKERGEARRVYNEAIASGHRAAIAEEERPDVFTMRVGNLPPGEEAEVELVLTAPLEVIAGEATYRFPLVVAPRYIPGMPLGGEDVGSGIASDTDAVPDASRITPPVMLPNYPNPVSLSLSVDIDTGGLAMENLRSTLHSVLVESSRERAHIEVRPGERINRDFILRWDIGEEKIATACLAANAPDEDHSSVFQLTLVPPSDVARAQIPRDVMFVLDRSGSMSGWKMVAARRALGRMLDTLSPQDRFNVLAFDDRIDPMPGSQADELIDATNRERYRAIEYLSGIDARGGTEMAAPLQRAANALAGGYEDRHRWIVLVTDGQVGNEDQILRDLGNRIKNVRIFTVGIDRAVNEGFLRRLSEIGGGGCELVESEERLDEVMDRVHHAIDTPVLTEVSVELEGGGARLEDVAPGRISGLFAGAPLVISGRVKGTLGEGAMVKVSGANALGDTWSTTVPVQETDNSAIGALWARKRLRELEDRFALGRGSTGALEREIVKISLDYQVLCRFTSFVAVDRVATIERDGEDDLRKVTQPVESPEGWDMYDLDEELEEEAAIPRPALESNRRSRGRALKASASMKKKSKPMMTREESEALPPSQSFSAIDDFATQSISMDGFAGLGGDMFADEPEPRSASAPMAQGSIAPGFGGGPQGPPPSAPAPIAPKGMATPTGGAAPAPQRSERARSSRGRRVEDRTNRTQAGVVKSVHINHMSPEQVAGKSLEHESDVWSLGVLLYRMIEGEDLFSADSDFQMLSLIMSGDRPEPFFSSGKTSVMERYIRAAVQQQVVDRPDMVTLASALEAHIDDAAAIRAKLGELVEEAASALAVDTSSPPPSLDNARYKVVAKVGQGGKSELWVGEDTQTGARVFIKTLVSYMVGEPDAVEDFLEPVSPSIDGTPTLLATGWVLEEEERDTPTPYVVLEAIEGVDLWLLLRHTGGALPEDVATWIAFRMARIMADCHALILPDGSRGLVHGRLAPNHVVLGIDGSVAIADFGSGVNTANARKRARQPRPYDWDGGHPPASPDPSTSAKVVERQTPAPKSKGLISKLTSLFTGAKESVKGEHEEKKGRDDFWK